MTTEELEKATGQELIEQRDYCGVDGYYGDYLDDVNAEMLKRFNRLAELEKKNLDLIQEKYNLEYRIENLENKIEHHQEVIDTFKKKNAELRADNAEWEKASDKWKNVYELTNNQLTKAKELLERLLITSCNSDVLNLFTKLQ